MSSPNSPVADTREALQAAVSEVAELNCFAFAEPVDADTFDERAAACSRWLCAEVAFEGGFSGVLRLAVPATTAEALCVSFIGGLDEDGPDERQVFDFTGELANMAVGSWLSRGHSDAVFNLSHPHVTAMAEGWQPRAVAGDAAALLCLDDAPVALWATITS